MSIGPKMSQLLQGLDEIESLHKGYLTTISLELYSMRKCLMDQILANGEDESVVALSKIESKLKELDSMKKSLLNLENFCKAEKQFILESV